MAHGASQRFLNPLVDHSGGAAGATTLVPPAQQSADASSGQPRRAYAGWGNGRVSAPLPRIRAHSVVA